MLRFLPWLLFVILAGAGDWHCEDEMTLGLLQVQTDVSETTQHISISSQMLHIAAGCIALVCLLLILFFGSADALVSLSIFMDLFMTTILTPLAPTFTADYQLIALLTSSKNLVTCLIAPLAGHFVDNNEAKSMRLGMLCAMLCSLCFAMVQNYWFWLAVRCLSGCSTAAIVWGGFAYCNRAHADEAAARSRAMASATAGLYAGVILGPQAGGLFVEDPRSLFLLLLAAQLFMYFALNRLPELNQKEKQMQKETEEVDMVSLIMDPDVRNPIVALFLALAFIAALDSTTFEFMVRLGYDQMKQNLTWLLISVPAILFTCMVPWLRSFVSGDTLQILAMLLGGFSSLIFIWPSYGLLAVTLLGTSVAGGIIDGNTPAMLSDRSQAKYGGTGQVFVLSNVADQAAFILGPAVGSLLCKHLSFPLMCQSFGGCMLLYGSVMALGRYHDFANAKQQGTLETTCAEWKDWKVATRCLQHRGDVDDGIGCLGIPIHLGQAFVYQSPGTPHPKGAIYGRFDHPTRLKLENCHRSQFSQEPFVLAFATYEAAVASLLARLRSKDQLLSLGEEHDTNVGLLRFFSETAAKRSFRFQQVGRDQISSLENLEAKMELLKIGGAKLCWVSCADLNKAQLSEWSQACQSAGALLVMDASFCPDANWELPGASVALHWCAVLSGRTDVYTCMLSTNDEAVFKSAQYFRQTMGNTPGNFECYLAFRGLLSLQCRMERQAASARYLVEQLRNREDLDVEVTGTSFQLKMDGFRCSASAALSRLSLVCCQVPFTKFSQVSPERTDRDWPASPSRALRTHAWLQGMHVLQVQVGLENPEDLLRDFSAAFGACPQPVQKAPEAKPVGFTSRMLQIAGNSSDEDDACARYPQREVKTLEKLMADAHRTRFAVTFASGSAAYQVLLDEFLSPGDHVIASNKLFVGAFEAFQDIAVDSYGVTFTFLDLEDLDAVAAAISPKTRLLWVEAASNPLGHPGNLPGLVRLCRPTTRNASPRNTSPSPPLQQRLLLVVDNTWCGPCMLQPALQGADLVIESLTKAIGGFSDLLLGAVCTDCAEMHIRLSQARVRLGIGPARLDCDLATSSLLTYEARIEVMSRNARSIAKVLDADHRISKVHFLGFQGSAEMKNGPSNMIAFYLDGRKEDAVRFLENLKLIKLAGSFGDCCTIVDMPYTMFVDKAVELKCGITDNLMRLSVGLEDIEDLISDILNALSIAF